MTVLTPASRAALGRLRAFKPGPTRYLTLPLVRRAAVLVLLYADRRGELRVVLTIRSAALRSYAGQAALPGGKADTVEESAFETARREAYEEIGLPMTDRHLPKGYSVEHLTELPCNLAITELGVKPCVAFIHAPGRGTRADPGGIEDNAADPARDLLPKLEVKEVAALFTAPFRNFLHGEDTDPKDREVEGEWHLSSGRSWLDEAWRVQQFFVPVTRGRLVRGGRVEDVGQCEDPAGQLQQDSAGGETPLHMRKDPRTAGTPSSKVDALNEARYRVFGLTADILVDCARIAYDRQPDFAYKQTIGDEDLIERLQQMGKLSPVKGKKDLLTRELMVKASKL